MPGVEFPEMRARLFVAASSLCDQELQDRLWRRGERVNDEEEGFEDTILFVIDELDWPTPTELVGRWQGVRAAACSLISGDASVLQDLCL